MKVILFLLSLSVGQSLANVCGVTDYDHAHCELVNAGALKQIRERFDTTARIVADNTKTRFSECRIGCKLIKPRHPGETGISINTTVYSADMTPCGQPASRCKQKRCMKSDQKSVCVNWPPPTTPKPTTTTAKSTTTLKLTTKPSTTSTTTTKAGPVK